MVNFARAGPGNDQSLRPVASRAGTQEALLGRGALREVAQSVALDQAIEFFGKIFRVIAGALQGLRHEENVKAQGMFFARVIGQMPLKQGVADTVKFGVDAQNLASVFDVKGDKAAMDVIQHIADDGGHLYEVGNVAPGKLAAASLNALGHAHHKVANPLQVGDALEAGEELPGLAFVDAGDGAGQLLVDAAFDLIQFFLAVSNGEKGHAGRVGQQILNVEGGVASDEAGAERHLH